VCGFLGCTTESPLYGVDLPEKATQRVLCWEHVPEELREGQTNEQVNQRGIVVEGSRGPESGEGVSPPSTCWTGTNDASK